MSKFTTKIFSLKREILTFSGKISKKLKTPYQKFIADITYGMLASESCLLTDVADKLHERTQKINVVDRLSRQLAKGIPKQVLLNYLSMVKKMTPAEPVVYIDDSDIVKPDGYKFEDLCMVRDGSKSTETKNVLEKGYHVTEACVRMANGHPVSFFSKIFSSKEKGFVSANDITFSAIERGVSLFGKATFILDRGYDDNKIFSKLHELKQDYVIRLTRKRKLLYGNKWMKATELCNRRKGKVKVRLMYKGKQHDAYISHVRCKITASRKDIFLVLVYGITQYPMMLVTNKEIKSKEDVIGVAKLYFSRWRVEEYFRAKKQIFQFENFRVRKLKAINALNFYITVCMAFLGHMSLKPETNAIKVAIIKAANPIKEKVHFCYYRIAKGISDILAYAKEGVRRWFKKKRTLYRQIRLKLSI